MFFFKFKYVNICALLLLVQFLLCSASKTWHPIGLTSMTRIGKKFENSDLNEGGKIYHHPLSLKSITRVGKRLEDGDPEESFIHTDDKRARMTNFIRTGRSATSCKVDSRQEKEPWYTNAAGGVVPKTNNELGEDLYIILNPDNPSSWQSAYNDQEDYGLDTYYNAL